jgi:hypothetical protein
MLDILVLKQLAIIVQSFLQPGLTFVAQVCSTVVDLWWASLVFTISEFTIAGHSQIE